MNKQLELNGMPEDGPLGICSKQFVAIKEIIQQAKLDLEPVEKEILAEMKKAKVPHFKVSVGGENYEFELVPGEDSLRCAKITKQPKKGEPQNIGKGLAKEAVGA